MVGYSWPWLAGVMAGSMVAIALRDLSSVVVLSRRCLVLPGWLVALEHGG